jgi:DNA-binding NtrC family response regulator
MNMTPPMKIVLVEDNADLCDSWVALLELDGHHVKTFLDGASALEDTATLHWCHVMITDYYLPDINGLELIGRVRELRDDLPAILLSGMRDRSVIDQLRKLPHTVFVPKPADADELETALRRIAASARIPGQIPPDGDHQGSVEAAHRG